MDQNVTYVLALMQRAAQAGYTHMLVSDAKFGHLATMDPHYFGNLALIRQTALSLNLEIVPALIPIGYSDDLLFYDPNLIEASPVTNALLVVSNGVAAIQADPPVGFPGGDFSDLSLWSWKDDTVVADNGTARVADPKGVNSWRGLDCDIIVVPWDYYQLEATLQFFAGLGNRQLIAGYYDSPPTLVTNWLNAARPYAGICGVMYTTWQNNYNDLETFEQLLTDYPLPSLWAAPRLLLSRVGGQPRLVAEGERGRNYVVEQSPDFSNWSTWTNVTANDATLTFAPGAISGNTRFFRAACVY